MMQNEKLAKVDRMKGYGRCTTHDSTPENTNNGVWAQGKGPSSIKRDQVRQERDQVRQERDQVR